MVGKSFSLKLAVNNIKNNRKFYLPYFLASIGIIGMFYIIAFLAISEGIEEMSAALAMIMSFGVVVMGIFAFIFLFYTNSFLLKRRKKEIGLYNILGMEKKHIGKILIIENVVISLSSIILGLLCGILFSKLVHLFLSWVFGVEPPFGIEISWFAVIITLALFGVLFVLTMIANLMSIHLAKPIELLYGGNVGEKEPRTKWLLAIIGIICLGIGYYIAITTESPLTAIMLFFVAVVLVIVGTYCLFTAGSVAILKTLKKNRKFYYKPGNFTAVSGLIYRMKQNAVGLANICILSTMVLVMVSGTVSLYAGMNDVLDGRYAGDVVVSVTPHDGERITGADRQLVGDTMKKVCREEGRKIVKYYDSEALIFSTEKKDGGFKVDGGIEKVESVDQVANLAILTADEYERISGEKIALEKDQVAVYSYGNELAEDFSINHMKFHVKERLDKFVMEDLAIYMTEAYYLVVADDQVLNQINDMQAKAYGGNGSQINTEFVLDMDGTDEEKLACYQKMQNEVYDLRFPFEMMRIDSKQEGSKDFTGLVGGFLFLGIFLGIVFTFAAALIIYYKQISEGYYDKDKFEIMQKVGMSKSEVKKTIRKQVLMVFFIPLIMAGIHILAAFKMITRLLQVFMMYNVSLFAICTIGTFVVFAVIYAIVYAVTAREYYKIVG
ncbi:ABC transporter permease [Emergencia timonensis]|uniref:ABC transporter permease n=1 Tax=Emergencia timonensis TaxID=1776384 RepID=A0A415E8J2_9FIRM|nr:FtsX-like permease family protein [Clostridiales bacterium]RHJ90106.1 ABC transporter permease [Emergencia timonensis]